MLDAILALMAAFMLVIYGLSLTMTTSSASDSARQTTLAYNAARQAIENARSFHGAKLADGTYSTEDGSMSIVGPLPQVDELSGGRAAIRIQTLRSSGPSLMKQAWVTIAWRAGGRAQDRSITVTTLVSAGGVAP